MGEKPALHSARDQFVEMWIDYGYSMNFEAGGDYCMSVILISVGIPFPV